MRVITPELRALAAWRRHCYRDALTLDNDQLVREAMRLARSGQVMADGVAAVRMLHSLAGRREARIGAMLGRHRTFAGEARSVARRTVRSR